MLAINTSTVTKGLGGMTVGTDFPPFLSTCEVDTKTLEGVHTTYGGGSTKKKKKNGGKKRRKKNGEKKERRKKRRNVLR